MVLGSNSVAVTSTLDIVSVSSKEFLDIHATTECRFTLKCICDIKKTQSPCHSCYIFEYVYPAYISCQLSSQEARYSWNLMSVLSHGVD